MFVGQTLGQFVAGSSWEAIPSALRHEARRALLNYFGCAIVSAADPVVGTVVKLMLSCAGEQRVSLVGRPERLDPMGAAFANAISANLLDYDDTHWNTAIHPTAPVAAPVLALAEQRGLSGAEVLHALILGAEVECRIGNAVSPQHYARGLHITATCGVFGAAAASAKLLNLSAEETWTALGIAASQSAGIIENLSTAAKNVAVGNAARNGLLAALLAQAGFSAAPAAIEGPFGWARAMGDEFRAEAATGELGKRWEFQTITYKPYPCGFVFHAVIDACIQLKEKLQLAGPEILQVVVQGNQLLLDRGSRQVFTDRDARVSIGHTAAISLLRGRAKVEDFTDAAVNDPLIRDLRQRVRAGLAADMAIGAASVTVTTRDGRSETAQIRDARGSSGNPMTDPELEAKFRDCAGHSVGRNDERIQRLWALDSAEDLAALVSLMAA